MVWSKLMKSSFRIHGSKHDKEGGGSRSRDQYSDVNEEYMKAFRAKSFKDMRNKVRSQMGMSRKCLDNDVGTGSPSAVCSSPSPRLPVRYINHLSDGLLEPRLETLNDMIKTSNLHHLLVVSLDACRECEQLLQIVHRALAIHCMIKRIMKLAKSVSSDCKDHQSTNDEDHGDICGEFFSCSLVRNPLSSFDTVHFRATQDSHDLLFEKLVAKHLRTRRKAMLSMGILFSFSLRAIIRNPRKMAKEILEMGDRVDRLGTQLDVAARGVYTLINDFDTLSRIGERLRDEIEHGRAIAEICARNCMGQVLKEVLKEFQNHENCCLELLEEFEEHIYLCLLNLSRSIGFLLYIYIYIYIYITNLQIGAKATY